MKKINFYQDIKVTIWKRQSFCLAANTEEEAIQQAEHYKTQDVTADFIDVTCTDLTETEEFMYPAENNGQRTIELYLKNDKRFLGGNMEKPNLKQIPVKQISCVINYYPKNKDEEDK